MPRCWASCDGEKIRIEKEKDDHEKDGNIDGKANGKIECYVNVFLKKPTETDLFEAQSGGSTEVLGKLRCDGED